MELENILTGNQPVVSESCEAGMTAPVLDWPAAPLWPSWPTGHPKHRSKKRIHGSGEYQPTG